jgi:hypothetical protein
MEPERPVPDYLEPEHTDIGAYVLGLLDPDETELFERHLLTCDRCTAELDEFAGLPDLLAPAVQPDDTSEPVAAAQPSATLLPRVLDGVQNERTRLRRRNMLALAAALVLLVAGPVAGLEIGRHSSATPNANDGVAMHLVMVGERHTATDPATGISATIGLEPKDWGTHVALQLSGVHGPLKCELVAVGKDGSRAVITTWLVPEPGYGVPGHTAPLVLHGGAAMTPSDIDHFEVRTDTQKTLISVPV